MKICIVGPSFGYGGANIVAATVGKGLAKNNEVYYYSYRDKSNYSNLPNQSLFFSSKREKKIINKIGKGLEMIVNKEFTPSKYKADEIQDLFRIIENQGIDIVILNSFIAVTIFSEKLKEKFPKLPIIAWMHESVEYSFGSLAKNYLKEFENSISVVDQIVCLTKKDLNVFKRYNKNSIIIYNPVQFVSLQKSKLINPVISFTTRLNINIKGLDFLMEIAKNLPKGWTIRVAANGSKEEIIEFEKLIEVNQVKDTIDYVGPLKGKELIDHYLTSSIFISTSRVESFQLVLIEAMECGLPVISFNHSGAKEVLNNGDFGVLIEGFNVEAMSNEINHLIQSREDLLILQEKSIERAKDFQLIDIINQWQLLLEMWV